VVKEKVDIKNLAVGITKLRKGKGTVILDCGSESEMKQLKDLMSEKLGKDFEIAEPKKVKLKLKIINIEKEEMILKDEKLIDTIKKQNNIDGKEFYIRIVKRFSSGRRGENMKARKENREEGSIILEVNEKTHELMLRKEKVNIGWKKYMIFNHYSVKRCFKCWGYYHLAKNCARQETCHKCAGSHVSNECKATERRCVNCMYKNKTYNLKINNEHDALNIDLHQGVKRREKKNLLTNSNYRKR